MKVRKAHSMPSLRIQAGAQGRLPEWKSSVIVRVPSDPLQPGRQIWLYYTHMADAFGNSYIAADFPPGAPVHFAHADRPAPPRRIRDGSDRFRQSETPAWSAFCPSIPLF